MKDRVTKNYFKDDGDTLVIGGRLVIEEDAELEGLDTGGDESSAATTETAGIVKQAEHQANFTQDNLADLETGLNGLIEKLVAAGIMAAE